jgi:cell division septation protein DedD
VVHVAAAPPAAEPTTAEAAAPSGALVVQLGSFASRDNADRLAHQVKSQGFPVSVVRGTAGRHLYRVLVGPAADHAAATQLEAKLRAAGHTGSIVPR